MNLFSVKESCENLNDDSFFLVMILNFVVEFAFLLITQWSFAKKRFLLKPKVLVIIFGELMALGFNIQHLIQITGKYLKTDFFHEFSFLNSKKSISFKILEHTDLFRSHSTFMAWKLWENVPIQEKYLQLKSLSYLLD